MRCLWIAMECMDCRETFWWRTLLTCTNKEPAGTERVEHPTCEQHENEKINIYCVSCATPTCSLCKVFGAHKDCDVAPLNVVFGKQKAELSECIALLVGANERVQAVTAQLEETCRVVDDNGRRQKSKVCESFDHLFAVLEERKSQMSVRISAEQDEKMDYIRGLKRKYSEHLDNAAKLLENAIQTMDTSEMAVFLQAAKPLLHKIMVATDTSHLDKVQPGYEKMDHLTANFERERRALMSVDFLKPEEDDDDDEEDIAVVVRGSKVGREPGLSANHQPALSQSHVVTPLEDLAPTTIQAKVPSPDSQAPPPFTLPSAHPAPQASSDQQNNAHDTEDGCKHVFSFSWLNHKCRCPAHSHTFHQAVTCSARKTDYAFEMASSNIRYGDGVSSEIGMDLQNLRARNVCVMTDKNLSCLPPVKVVLESLAKNGVEYKIYDSVRVEPTDSSFKDAISFAKNDSFDVFVAVGGGSVIDTCKAANLYSCHPDADFLDFVNAPIGKGKPITGALKPLIAVPTTAGTGSETTGVAIFDYEPLRAKTGIASRAIRPTLGVVDPKHTLSMPSRVAANSGFDVLCHALESYTALPYHQRAPCPTNPINRPAYQGSNPISDVWSRHALHVVAKYMKRAVQDPEDLEARSSMHLASVFAGIGFGNAGVHLCHGMSYPIAGNVKTHKAEGYNVDHPLVPHGLSVVLTAPAVFTFTAPMCPERHLEAAHILGADIRHVKRADAGAVLADVLRQILFELQVEDGLAAVGYNKDDIPALVQGTIPQERVTKLSPRAHSEDDLTRLFEASMKLY
ncbi:hydroxyacid-oxoacid transhydrogenase, mitochondrial isoform X5 [Dunckerocampus dactyliophorus]|nr:hydroxyacid-oxoacid transhydrogenase, mitochondrial isoform X5 [Dunckerocampus dactyliophorus]